MLCIIFLVMVFDSLLIKELISSNEKWILFVNFLFNTAQIFSAGFNSGLYGGRNRSWMFLGICNDFALWNGPLSSTIIFNSSGRCFENSSMNSWNISALQAGISAAILSPLIGEYAPNRYVLLNTWWKGQIGFTPLAVKVLPFLVKSPNRHSSSK